MTIDPLPLFAPVARTRATGTSAMAAAAAAIAETRCSGWFDAVATRRVFTLSVAA